MGKRRPKYDLVRCTIQDVADLFRQYHGYGSVGRVGVYVYAVVESGSPVAAYVWQPPPPGAAKAVGGTAPYGVLALSRMVAVPRSQRRLRHVSTPLRRQMRTLIDRGRWPTLLTYSDAGLGHTGHVYRCSGWTREGVSKRATYTRPDGTRASIYTNGRRASGLTRGPDTVLTRWTHRVAPRGREEAWMQAHGWVREPIPGKYWRSGAPAMRVVRREP